MTDLNLGALNSATKYPSIETYHEIDPKTGRLAATRTSTAWDAFNCGPVVLTEKIDGTNGRVVVMPDGDWFIGSREELLYARGDRIENPALSIVPVLKPLAPSLLPAFEEVCVYFFEVYGKNVGPAAGHYSSKGVNGVTGCHLFDVAAIPLDVLTWPREQISSWRRIGGQQFASEVALTGLPGWMPVQLTPRLATVDAAELPTSLEGMERFLREYLPTSAAALDDVADGRPEGIVLRTEHRSVIAKARFQDYERTLAPPQRRRER